MYDPGTSATVVQDAVVMVHTLVVAVFTPEAGFPPSVIWAYT